MQKTILSFGEILWDMLPAGPVLGGAPCNFAYRINNLGDMGLLVSRLGCDELGDQAFSQVEYLGMDTRFIQRDNEHPTGTVDITFDENHQPDYVINTGVAYDRIETTGELFDAASNIDCICFGTLMQRCPQSQATLIALLDSTNARIKLLDINLRKNCYTEQSIRSSLTHANILKLNDDEIDELAGIFNLAGMNIPDWADQLIKQFDLTHCLVTLGERGTHVASNAGQHIYVPGFAIDLADPCGAGDAFTAGFIHMFLREQPLELCCTLGNAMGAMVAEQDGCTTPITPEQIERFIESNPPRINEPLLQRYAVEFKGDIPWKI